MTIEAQGKRRLTGWRIDGLMLVLVCAAGALLSSPGVFSVDESHYLLASKAMAQGQEFHIDNGYENLKDPAKLFFYTVIPDRVKELGTISTVPPFHAILASPFLWLGGLSGLIWLNLLAFAASLVAVRRLALKMHDSEAFALASAAAFGLASFSLEYAFGIWPHALSQALAAWALLALVSAPGAHRPALMLFFAGLLAGVGCGVRLQHVLELPLFALAAFCLLNFKWRSLLLLAGWLLPVLALALINLHRLDSPNPFTYGAGSSFAGPVGLLLRQPLLPALGMAALGLTTWFARKPGRAWAWALLIGLGVLATLSLPAGRNLLLHWAGFAGYHLLDTSLLGDLSRSAGSTGNELGQVLYGGVLKKSLLQAAPWLLLAVLTAWTRLRDPAVRQTAVRTVALVGLGGTLLLPFIASAGGLCFNPRYFVDMLPALAPLALLGIWHLGPAKPWSVALGAMLGLGLALPILLAPGKVGTPAGGLWPMLAPLALAVLTLVLTWVAQLKAGLWNALALAGLCAGMSFAALIHLGLDLPRSLSIRNVASRMVQVADPIIEGPSILAAAGGRKDVFSPLKLDRDLWILRMDPDAEIPPASLKHAPANRHIWLLTSGIPPERIHAWTTGRLLRRVEDKGLVFLELRGNQP